MHIIHKHKSKAKMTVISFSKPTTLEQHIVRAGMKPEDLQLNVRK